MTSIADSPAQPSTWALAFAEHAVLSALDVANRRLLRRVGRSARHRDNGLREIDPVRWHTVIPTRNIDVDELLDGVLRHFDATAHGLPDDTAACIRDAITTYLRVVIAAGLEHNRDTLARLIDEAGCFTSAA